MMGDKYNFLNVLMNYNFITSSPEDLVRYALNMIGDHAKTITSEEEFNKFTVSDSEYMFVGMFQNTFV